MAFSVVAMDLPEVLLIRAASFVDERGLFSETYNAQQFRELGIDAVFVQDNHSVSKAIGTVRGMHYQTPPFAQHKLLRVTRGEILDVTIDLRKDSPNFGKHTSVVLNADNWKQIYIPIGFAHGFCTLKPDTEVIYKVSSHYSPEHDRGILWSDPDLGIAWPVTPDRALVSDKDRRHPKLRDTKDLF